MPPGLSALLQSPNTSDSTVHAGKTLPDISLGSLGSSFRSDDEGERALRRPGGSATPAPSTPSLGVPPTIRKASSSSALPDPLPSDAPRRSRYLRSASISSASDTEAGTGVDARYANGLGDDDDGDGGDDESRDDSAGVLQSLSIGSSPGRRASLGGGAAQRTPYHAGPSKRSGRHSVAANVAGTAMTLREQEQNVDALQKDNFNLQLENHFLKERLASMAPDHIEAALNENVKLKIEILNLSKELKKSKKLLMQQDRDLAAAARGGGGGGGAEAGAGRGGDARELEAMWRDEKERRRAAEDEAARLRDELAGGAAAEAAGAGAGEEAAAALRAKLDDAEASEDVWRRRTEELEDELERLRAEADDARDELDKLTDARDRAQDEAERLRGEAKGLSESVGVSKGREARTIHKLEQELAEFQQTATADVDALEDINALRDKLAAAQLDLDRRDQELDELNAELDGKVQDHEREINQVEAEWRDEVLEARAQVDELKDEREQELEDIRKALMDREDELAGATDRVAELEAAQAETHDRLEDTLRNIERDNADKDHDLLDANREVEVLGQKVYELEEAVDELRTREAELSADLRAADEAFENTKAHYENLVSALKDARAKAVAEADELAARLRREEEARHEERAAGERERKDEAERAKKVIEDREHIIARLSSELEAARDRVAQRDRDLASVQAALRTTEDAQRRLGADHTSDRFSLELEIERVRRDLDRCEDELERAREEGREREDALRARERDVAELLDKQRDLESKLASERQGRLNLSDKLDVVAKTARQHERDAQHLRDRLDEVEPLLSATQDERHAIQKQSEAQRQERTELLLRVFKDVNRFLGAEDTVTPANFGVFRDTLVSRLRSINGVRADFEKRIKDTEASVDQRMASLKRQLEQKWRALDAFEASVKKLEVTRMQWRAKYATKEGELDAAKSRNAELSQQLSTLRAGSSSESSTQLRALTERAERAEKRAAAAQNQLAALEQRLGDLQARAGAAENKWEARVKEYESRLRVAGEKIKTEKQGGKERAQQLEAQVRDLERQVDAARKRNERADGIVASAAHLVRRPSGE